MDHFPQNLLIRHALAGVHSPELRHESMIAAVWLIGRDDSAIWKRFATEWKKVSSHGMGPDGLWARLFTPATGTLVETRGTVRTVGS
jgi:hypothetical protein